MTSALLRTWRCREIEGWSASPNSSCRTSRDRKGRDLIILRFLKTFWTWKQRCNSVTDGLNSQIRWTTRQKPDHLSLCPFKFTKTRKAHSLTPYVRWIDRKRNREREITNQIQSCDWQLPVTWWSRLGPNSHWPSHSLICRHVFVGPPQPRGNGTGKPTHTWGTDHEENV